MLAASILLALSAGAVGGIATAKAIPSWYVALNKPSWSPPNRVFGPVWTLLYIMMGVAAWLVWKKVGFSNSAIWLVVYGVQLLLNLVWSLVFFGLRNPGLAFAEILMLWAAILATLFIFWAIDPLAGMLLVPYLVWVSFASFLNGSIWRLNTKCVPSRRVN